MSSTKDPNKSFAQEAVSALLGEPIDTPQATKPVDEQIDKIIVKHNQYIDAVWQGKHQMYSLPETHQKIKALISNQVASAVKEAEAKGFINGAEFYLEELLNEAKYHNRKTVSTAQIAAKLATLNGVTK